MEKLGVFVTVIALLVMLGAAVTGVVTWVGGLKIQQDWAVAAQECEKFLPRNQHCTLTATPPPQPAEEER